MRTKKIILNTLAETIPYLILGIIGFVKVRVIIDHLGSDLNGYYQFINQIIGYLFLIESGFGRAVIYKLYKPFANKDYLHISEIFNGSRKIFRGIGLAIFGLIVISTILIPLVFNIESSYQPAVIISFFIISASYLIAYFGKENSYYALFCADQKKYIFSLIFNGLKIIDDLLIILVAFYFKSLISIALVILIIKIIEEITIRIVAKKHFPFVNKTKKEDISSFKMTKDLIWHQLSFLVSNNVDMVVLMYFINPFIVSVYATYNFIARFLNELTTRINNIFSYAFGNMFAAKEEERSYQIHDEYFILSTFLSLIIALTFMVSIRPFVNVWIDNSAYKINYITVVMFSLNLFLWTIYSPLIAVINAKGLYKESKHIVIITALINVLGSITLVALLKNQSISIIITGILIATVISSLYNIIARAKLVKKLAFPKLKLKDMLMGYLFYILIFISLALPFFYLEGIVFNYSSNIITSLITIVITFLIIVIFALVLLLITKPNTKLVLSRIPILFKNRRVNHDEKY